MQSFVQWKRLDRYVKQSVRSEKRSTNHESSTHNLKILETPTPSIDHDEFLGAESRPEARATTNSTSNISQGSDENGWEVSSTSRLPQSELGFNLEGIKGRNEDEDGRPATFLVESDRHDNCNPRAWPRARKVRATVIVFLIVFVCGWASGAHSSSNAKAAAEFHVSKEAETLATALFLFGIALGALLSGPISETAGRNPTYLVFMLLYMVAVLVTALAPNFAVQIIFRFFSGLFSSPPLTIYGGSLADMYGDVDRSLVWPLFALSPILGPILAPVAGGWVVQSTSLSWRWIDWIALINSAFVFILALLFLPETFSPMLLQWKAVALRKSTGETRFKAQLELQESLRSRLKENITRPIRFFTREPIVILIGFYLTLIYVLVFTFFDGFTFIFVDTYGFTQGQRGLAFLSMTVGALLNTLIITPFSRAHYIRHLRAAQKDQQHKNNADEPLSIAPEIRLVPAILCSPLFPISLFWLGWTNRPSITPWSDLIAAGLFGFSLMGIFVSSYQYVIDSYETYSSSALSSITFLRYAVAGGMVIAAMPMYQGIGVKWVLTLMGTLGVLVMTVPWLFWRFGGRIRRASEFARKF